MADLSRKERIPKRNTKNMRGNTRENSGESLKPTRFDYTCARSKNTKGDTRYTINKGRYKG